MNELVCRLPIRGSFAMIHYRSLRRPALLLEVLIAMALLAGGLGVLLRGPVLLLKAETQAWRRVAIQWELDRAFLRLMSHLIQTGSETIPREIQPFKAPFLGGSSIQGFVLWDLREAPIPTANKEQPPVGKRMLLIAHIEVDGQKRDVQRTLFLED